MILLPNGSLNHSCHLHHKTITRSILELSAGLCYYNVQYIFRTFQVNLKSFHLLSKMGKRITVDGKECLNLATHNYLGFVEHQLMEQVAIKTLRKYGVGSCGPRGFYGTVGKWPKLEIVSHY